MSGSHDSTAAPPTSRPSEIGLCPGCGAHVTVGDRICDLCGADLVGTPPKPVAPVPLKPPPLGSPRPLRSSTASDDELFALQHGLGDDSRELGRSIRRGVAAGLVLAAAIVFGVGVLRRPPAASPPAPVKLPVGPAPKQVATAEEIGIRVNGVAAGDPARSEGTARAVVESHLSELEGLYERALRSGSTEGVVTLHMTVGEDGAIHYVRASPLGIDSATLVSAVEEQARGWRFPAAGAGVASVHYPLVFHLPRTDPHELIARVGGSAPPAAPDPGTESAPPAGGRLPGRRILQETQLHGGPSWSTEVLRDLDPGESVVEIARQGDWVKVMTTDPGAASGFVWSEHVSAD